MQKFLMFSVFSVLFLCNQVFGVLYSGPFKSDGSNLPPGAVTKNYSTSTTVTINATGSQNALNVVGTSNISSLVYVNSGTGYVGIGTSSPTTLLSVNGVASFGSGTSALPSIAAFGDLNTGAWFPAADTFAVSTGGSERIRVDSSGRVLVGGTSSVGVGASGGAQLQNQTISTGIVQSWTLWNASANGPIVSFGKSRGASVGTLGIVSNNDILGQIRFSADDGTDLQTSGASIQSEVDGSPGVNDMPTRLSFSTTLDGEASPKERMRINNAGNVGIGTTAPNASAILDVQSTTKGFRLPNMTAAQMYAIVSPAAGLMIWNTSSVNVSVYTGSAWANVKDL